MNGFLPIRESRWLILLLRVVFPKRSYVQIRRKIYLLRLPDEDAQA